MSDSDTSDPSRCILDARVNTALGQVFESTWQLYEEVVIASNTFFCNFCTIFCIFSLTVEVTFLTTLVFAKIFKF